VSTPPPPSGDDLEATVAMPRVTPPPPPHPTARRIDPAIVEPRDPVRVSPSAPTAPSAAPGPSAPAAAPVSGTVIPPTATAVHPQRPPYEFGHPVGYVFARLFAFVLDVALVSAVVTSLAYSFIAVNPITGLPTNSQRGFDATLAIGIAIALVYVWVAEAAFGTTIGKLAVGLHVFAVRGGPVGLGRAFVRALLRPVDALVIGGLLALLPSHRRLGDLAGGTIVARSRLRGFAPLIGWLCALIVAGLPLILTGVNKTFLSLLAFYQFFPGIVARLWLIARELSALLHLGIVH
jgi:uncharacterized RDD family membrane protein YckC